MNPSAVSAEPQADIPIWQPGGWTVYSGLDSRHIVQTGHLGWDWEEPGIADQLPPTGSASHQQADYNTNTSMTDAIATGTLRQYHGVLPSNITPNLISQASWGVLNLTGANMDGPPHSFYTSSVPCIGAVGNSGSNVFSTGNTKSGSDQHQNQLLELINWDQRRIQDIVKREFGSPAEFTATLGLNLNGRTYFSAEDNAMARLCKRFRPDSPGAQVPICQAEGCKADLRIAKHYHRRHKVCEFHSKAASVLIAGQTQRFCQQCSRFHVLSEFDEGKRSCRKRLADHNRRRRKPQPNSTSTNESSVTESAPQISDVQENNTSSSQAKTLSSSSEAQVGNSTTSSTQVMLQHASKTQTPLLPEIPRKDDYKDVLQTAPNLSLSTFAETAPNSLTTQVQSSGQSLFALDLPIPWLRNTGSGSAKVIDTATRSMINYGISPNRCLLPPLSHTSQNLISLPAARDHIAHSSQWAVENTVGQVLGPNKNDKQQSTSDNQESELTLLEDRAMRFVPSVKSEQSVEISLGFQQEQLQLRVHSITGNQQDFKFLDLQAVRPFNQANYSHS